MTRFSSRPGVRTFREARFRAEDGGAIRFAQPSQRSKPHAKRGRRAAGSRPVQYGRASRERGSRVAVPGHGGRPCRAHARARSGVAGCGPRARGPRVARRPRCYHWGMIQRAAEPPPDRIREARVRLPRPSGEVLAMLVAALVLRVAYVLAVHRLSAQPSSDSIAYDQLGWNLARGMGFQLNGEVALYPTAKAPLLPWLVSLLYRATGHVYFAALLLQCAIGAFIPVLVRALGRTMFGFRAGRVAGWLAVVHPLLVFFSGYLLTENLFCVMVLAALLASVEWLKAPRPGR